MAEYGRIRVVRPDLSLLDGLVEKNTINMLSDEGLVHESDHAPYIVDKARREYAAQTVPLLPTAVIPAADWDTELWEARMKLAS